MKKQHDQSKRVGIWLRVSTEDQARGDSPQHHEARARQYAAMRGWTVVEVYHLEGTSGKDVMDHPETERMLADIKRDHITGLIFSKLARLARNTKQLLELSDIFEHNGADLISLQESIDTSTPSGRLFFTLFAALSQWEREEIADRVAASVPIRAKLGKPVGGKAPFGYQWVDKKLVPNPDEAPVRRRIYELFKEHRRKKTVARLLNEGGFRTRAGAKFSGLAIDRLIRGPEAKGLHRANYTKSPGKNKAWELKPESEWVYVEVEPIVDEETWDICNQILDENHVPHKRPGPKPVHLFAGIVECECGNKMYVPSKSVKYTCAKCRNKIPVDDLEAIFYEQLKNFFLSPDEIARHLESAESNLKDRERMIAKLQTERTAVQKEMDKMYHLYINDEIPAQGFGQRYNPLQERFDQLDNQIPTLQAEADYLRISYLSSDQIINEAQDLYSHWPNLTPEEKRLIIENMTDFIRIGNNSVDIRLLYLPPFSEIAAKKARNPSLASRTRLLAGLFFEPANVRDLESS